MSLNMLKPGEAAVVTAIGCSKALQERLADMGLVSGTKVRCRYQSPRKDVSALEVRGSLLAIRVTDLQMISGRCL